MQRPRLTQDSPRMVEGLSPSQRSLMEMMRTHQFGRIEYMAVRAGQPILDSAVKVVRIARLSGESNRTEMASDGFEPKKQVRDLFNELNRLHDGIVIRLEFRHGLPFLLETAAQ